MIPLRTEWQAITDTGLVRELNEDRYLATETAGLWAVADGMGGLARGDWAAAVVVDAMAGLQPAADFDTVMAAAASAAQAANAQIFAEAQARGTQMGATIVALVIRDRRFGVLWAGDSRAYLLRGQQLHRLSRDHSQVQELIDRGLLTTGEAATHPLRHVLTRAVGVAATVELDMVSDAVVPGDVFLLCSDGLHGVIGDEELAAALAAIDSGDTPDALVARCHARGAPDNVTLITLVATEPTQLQFGALAMGSTG